MRKISEYLFSNWTLASLLLVGSMLHVVVKVQMFDAPAWVFLGLDICIPVGASIAAVLPGISEDRRQQFLRLAFIYFFCAATTQLISPVVATRLSGLAFRVARYMQIGVSNNWNGFYFSHLLAFNVLAGLLGGLLVNFKQKHAIAMWVWAIPAAVLAFKMSTLEGYSLFESRVAFVGRHFFADCQAPLISTDLWYVEGDVGGLQSCVDQLFYTAPFYAAVGFSLGAWLARKQEWFRQNFFPRDPEDASPQS